MLGILLSLGAVAIVGVVLPAITESKNSTYGSELESYINSHSPRDTADVERLTKEYDQKASRRFL